MKTIQNNAKAVIPVLELFKIPNMTLIWNAPASYSIPPDNSDAFHPLSSASGAPLLTANTQHCPSVCKRNRLSGNDVELAYAIHIFTSTNGYH
jgi:hypothetical protein